MSRNFLTVGKYLKLLSGFPFSSKYFSSEEGFPLIRIRDIQDSKIETYYTGPYFESYVIKNGDILIGMDGDFHVRKWQNSDGLLNQRILKVEVTQPDIISLRYIYYWLLPYIKKINDVTAATTVKHLSVKDLQKASGLLPDVKKQEKAAEILETIDQTIEKTKALIQKHQQIKQGLMHDLFTRGVTSDGKLRPARDQAPELYKETPIGWIPKKWGCKALETLLSSAPNNMRSGPFGSSLLKSELVEDGIPFLGIDNIHIEKFIPIFHRFVSLNKFKQLSKYAIRKDDVIITIMGTVGRCAVVPQYLDLALSSKHLWTMTFDKSIVIPELVCWQLNHAGWVKAWFRKQTQGGIMDAIQSKTLKTLKLPLPPYNEQVAIYERYKNITQKIQTEQEHFFKLTKQKSGLMQDLLTGKVRVKVGE
ncbi:restriction endonuclease subunit S [Desulfobacter postgatei]|uniref:Restriction endonuclease S subunit n=1 Tax=Desulfobacter postgatei 2ac9 TaxID=879212 RepID=I5B143_9BACT|nr:restriction endonuclease subunit S [Desulfobacter postgatei]EIM63206.1 restriction endonuclease S subunit [Desulfobacter postgatei 2ac9]